MPRELEPRCQAPLDVWEAIADEHRNEIGMIRRKHYRKIKDIYWDIHRRLNISVCKCGHEWKPKKHDAPCPKCKGTSDDRVELIDEYDSMCAFGTDQENRPCLLADEELHHIAIFAEEGGNEGYSVWVQLIGQNTTTRVMFARPIYRIKSFRGFDHCNMLVQRLQKILGVWPLGQIPARERPTFCPMRSPKR